MTVTSLEAFYGRVKFPTAAEDVTGGTLVSVFDPALAELLAFFKSAVNAELSPAWDEVIAGTVLAGTDPVTATFWENILPYLAKQVSFKFPLLTLYRGDDESAERTLAEEHTIQEWILEWVLPPLDAPTLAKVGAARNAIANLIKLLIRRGWHPQYQSGRRVFSSTYCQFATVKHKRTRRGFWAPGPEDNGPVYPILQLIFETTERDGLLVSEDEDDFDASDYTLVNSDDVEDETAMTVLMNTDQTGEE